MTAAPTLPANVRAAFDDAPATARDVLLGIRNIIYRTAASNPHVGPLEETLKWGEPAYLTTQSKSGSTIRLAWKPAATDKVGLYFNCQTTLVETIRENYPETFAFQKNRAVLLDITEPIPVTAVTHICEMAMTYHSRSRR